MDENENLKKFVQAVNNYPRQKTDFSELSRLLELASSTNWNTFSANSVNVSNFYVSLHDLLQKLDLHSMILWPALSVLQQSCQNPKTRTAVIHTYKFIPVVSRFLDMDITCEQQEKILNVLSELTYGVKITWQEAHLPVLIETLAQIITTKNKSLLTPALTTLVNLCYKNPQALYLLSRKVELKKFMKLLSTLTGSLSIRVQVCKMLMILGELKGQMPNEDILHFVDVSFYCVSETFKERDTSTLRNIVDFFKDVNEDPQMYNVISQYPKTLEDTKRILEMLGKDDDDQAHCVAILLDLIPTIIKMKPSKTQKIFPDLIRTVTPWLNNTETCLPVLNILMMVTELLQGEGSDQAANLLSRDIFTKLLELTQFRDCNNQILAGIMLLFAEIATISFSMRETILELIDDDFVKTWFENLSTDNLFYENCMDDNFSNHLSISLLFLVSTLSVISEKWKDFYLTLLGKKEILWSIAIAIINGDKSIKMQALRLVSSPGWGKDTLNKFCQIMSEMKQSDGIILREESLQRTECVPLYSSEHRINELLENFKVGETTTSAVMELYEYKLSAMGQSERQLEAALDAADKRCIGLNHQVAQQRSQIARLHQTLFDAQHLVEGRTAERQDLMKQLEELRKQAAQEKNTQHQKIKLLSTEISNLKNLNEEHEKTIAFRDARLAEQLNSIQELTKVYESACAERDNYLKKISTITEELEEQRKLNNHLETEMNDCQRQITECKTQIDEFQTQNSELKKSLNDLEEKNSQKDEMLAECEKKILHLEHIREAVLSVARNEKF